MSVAQVSRNDGIAGGPRQGKAPPRCPLYTTRSKRSRYGSRALRVKRATFIVAMALAITTPSFIVFGHMSDRVGRKKIMLAGCGLAALTHVPIYIGMKHFGNPGGLPAPDHRRAESHD